MNPTYTAIDQKVPIEFLEKYGKYDSPIRSINVNVDDFSITLNYVEVERDPCTYITDFILLELFNHISNFSNFDFRFNSLNDQVDFFERYKPKSKFHRFINKTPKTHKNTFMIFCERDKIILRAPKIFSDYRTADFIEEVNNLLLNHQCQFV